MYPLLPYLLGASTLFALALSLFFIFYKKNRENELVIKDLRQTYAPVIYFDEAIAGRKQTLQELEEQILSLKDEYASKKSIYDALVEEVEVYETNLEDISYGLYTPAYSYDTSSQYKEKLEDIRLRQKALIQREEAVRCGKEWTVQGSREEGRRMTRQYSKLMLRAFNGECDAAVARVSWNNITNMVTRIHKAHLAINKLASVQECSISPDYFNLKLAELKLEFELQEKLHAEKEEQRQIREQMREEERAQRELEAAQRKAEDEETRYQKALIKARQEVQQATGEKLVQLNAKVSDLEAALELARQNKERALSMAQQTKCGHVYVISNIGSFGEDVFKIGMTRRLEPLDRVRELGDASVPFSFDVHAMVYSDNAPELENLIHKRLSEHKVNLINDRREFFRVPIDHIESIFQDYGLELSLTRLAEAREYRESISIRDAKRQIHEAKTKSPFPEMLT